MINSILKPCPFCGSKHVRSDFMETDNGVASWIRCLDCGAYGPGAKTVCDEEDTDNLLFFVETLAYGRWNMRAGDADDHK